MQLTTGDCNKLVKSVLFFSYWCWTKKWTPDHWYKPPYAIMHTTGWLWPPITWTTT